MPSITVNPIATTNTVPMITGSVSLDRKKGHTINVILNYETYELFDGNLGLEEYPVSLDITGGNTEIPGMWKLHLSDPLPTGIYEVEAYVIDKDNKIIASDDSENEVTIYVDPTTTGTPPQTLLEKVNKLSALMAAFNMLSMAAQSAFNSKGVHPVTNDDSSTHLHGRGKEEAAKSAEEKDRKKKKLKGATAQPVPVPPESRATRDAREPDPNTIDPNGVTGEAGTIMAQALNRGNPESAGSTTQEAIQSLNSAPDLTQEILGRSSINPINQSNPTTPFG